MNKSIQQDLQEFRELLQKNGTARGEVLEELESRKKPTKPAQKKLAYKLNLLKLEQRYILRSVQICKEFLECEAKK